MKTVIITIIAGIFLTSCTYNKQAPISTCNSSSVSFANDVNNIITSQCLSCHNNGFLSGGINLQGYTNVRNIAQTGLLVNVISHNAGVSPMPKNATKLDNCSIEKIKQWVSSGMPNN